MILSALDGMPLSIYGNDQQICDWLHVADHVGALCWVVAEGKVGRTRGIESHKGKSNIRSGLYIYDLRDDLTLDHSNSIASYGGCITCIADRPVRDHCYAIYASKIQREHHWIPAETFGSGLHETAKWCLNNAGWCQRVRDGSYQHRRLGAFA